MTSKIFRKLARGVLLLLAVVVALTPSLTASSGQAATSDPKYRATSSPNVFYPVTGSKIVRDLKSYTNRHKWTDIKAACGAGVRATHPGVAAVWGSGTSWTVRVTSNAGGVITYYSYLARPSVANGAIVQSGQWIGTVGRHPRSKVCDLYFSVSQHRTWVNPTTWLNWYVGRPARVENLFDSPGFTIASMNLLGASHTPNSRYGSYEGRLDRAMQLWDARRLDVIGTQEFQDNTQFVRFSAANDQTGTWGSCFWDTRPYGGTSFDTENALLFRNSTMELVPWEAPVGMLPDTGRNNDATQGCKFFEIPYFTGTRRVPVALLKEKATGRTAYFLNVHNPASWISTYGNQAANRAKAIAIEKQLIIALRATGRPVFITGDFNDRQTAFCAMTANKLTISPNSIPSTGCAYPKAGSIDWIFAAGQARFSSFVKDSYPQTAKISDHPIVYARTHLQN